MKNQKFEDAENVTISLKDFIKYKEIWTNKASFEIRLDLKKFREKYNLTKEQVSKIIDRSISQINRIENQDFNTSQDVIFRLQQWEQNGEK